MQIFLFPTLGVGLNYCHNIFLNYIDVYKATHIETSQ